MGEWSQDLKLYSGLSEVKVRHFHRQPVSSMNHSRISSLTRYLLNSICLGTQTTLMSHLRTSWLKFNGKNIPCRGRASFTKASKAKGLCKSIHARDVLFQAMRSYKKSQAINIYVQPSRGVKKIYSHARQYAKITYKMSFIEQNIFHTRILLKFC